MKCEGQGLGKLHRDLLGEASVVYRLKRAVVRSEREEAEAGARHRGLACAPVSVGITLVSCVVPILHKEARPVCTSS
jgi:hypothetical protein